MNFTQKIRNLARSRHRSLVLICVLITLTAASPFLAHETLIDWFDRIDERTEEAEKQERAQRIHDRLIPKSGTTPGRINAVSIGMTGREVDSTLGIYLALGSEMWPYAYSYNELHWTTHDIPVKDLGYLQAIFIDHQLVGLGSLDPDDGRLCGGCLYDMLNGKRDWLEGIPYQMDGLCPVCQSKKLIPLGANLRPDDYLLSISIQRAEN